MTKILRHLWLLSFLVFSPAVALAQVESPDNFSDLIKIILGILELLIPVIIMMALIVFFWGLAKFVYSAGDPEAVKNGKQLMIWGIIGIFIMASLFGILTLLGSTFAIDIGIPFLPTGGEAVNSGTGGLPRCEDVPSNLIYQVHCI